MVGVPFSCGEGQVGQVCPSPPAVYDMSMCVVLVWCGGLYLLVVLVLLFLSISGTPIPVPMGA